MNKEEKLKPCPFCGGEADIVSTTYYSGRTYDYVAGCRFKKCLIKPRTEKFEFLEEAITTWNTRA